VTTNSLTRAQFNTIVCFFGLVYLIINSYYIAKPPETVVLIFKLILLLMNIVVHVAIHISTRKNCELLETRLIQLGALTGVVRTIKIKLRMMRAFLFSAHGFFCLMYVCMIMPQLSASTYQCELMTVIRELVLFFTISFYL